MIGLFKALLGVATVGGGVVLPVAMSKSGTSTDTNTLKEHAKESGRALGGTLNRLVGGLMEVGRKEARRNKENSNFSEVIKDLSDKGCQAIQNPVGSQDGFHTLFACKTKQNKGKQDIPTTFYYLGSRDSVKEMGSGALKEIVTADYKNDGQIMLKLKDSNEQISISVVAGEGGWSNFNNVNLGEKCQIETKMLGGDDLRCELTDTKGKTFFYNFSVF